jgi:hypothetical protein
MDGEQQTATDDPVEDGAGPAASAPAGSEPSESPPSGSEPSAPMARRFRIPALRRAAPESVHTTPTPESAEITPTPESADTTPAPDGVASTSPVGPAGRASRWWWLQHEWTLAILGGLLIAAVLTWPTLKHPASTIPGDLGDPLLQAWQVAWGGHALLNHPLNLWYSNTFYPESYSYVYSDTLLGYAPAGWFGSGVEAAIVRYNLLYVLLHALAFIGAYALVRQLGAGRLAGAVAGVAWAFAPWRLAHAGHLNILSIGGIALSLAMLARGHGWSLRYGHRPQRHRPGWVVAGWLVAAWQVSLGFGIGLPLVYFLAGAGIVGAAGYGWFWWRRRARPAFGRRMLVANLVGGGLFAVTTVGLGMVYLKVVELNPQARRGLEWTEQFSPPWKGFFIAPGESWLWGERHALARSQLDWPPEMTLLPGLTLFGLACAGLVISVFPLRHRILLGLGVLATAFLALGRNFFGDGDPGYLTLSKHLPGWDALRTPGRMMIWTSLLLAILAAGVISAMVEWVASRPTDWRRPILRAALVLPLAMVVAEGVNRTGHPEVAPAPAAMRVAREPLLVLPSDGLFELQVMLWSTDGFPRVANGLAGFTPTSQERTRAVTGLFPDPTSVSYLRDLGIRTVVVFPNQLADTPWAGVVGRPIDGLGITREEIDGVLVYHLDG